MKKNKSPNWLLSCTVLVSLGGFTAPATSTVAADCVPPVLSQDGENYQLFLGACNSLTRSGDSPSGSVSSDNDE